MAVATTIATFDYGGDPRLVNKPIYYDPQGNNIINAYLSSECDILHPQIIIPYNDTRTVDFNYAYIPGWDRYYFVTGYSTNSGGQLVVDLSVDVLMTYATEILDSDVTVVRWSGAGINYVKDDKLPLWETRTYKKVHNLQRDSTETGYLSTATHRSILIGLV